MLNKIASFLLGLALTTTACYSAPSYAESIDPNRALIMEGVIAQGNILPLGAEMLRRANKGEKEVQMIINSPGGEVITGFLFLNTMQAAQAKGLKVKCYVSGVAASMAYQILLHCNERHTLSYAFLLWHRARVMLGGLMGSPITAPQALSLGKRLEATDDAIFSQVVKAMGKEVSLEELSFHFEAETLHVGRNLHKMAPHFITAHDSIDGLFEALLNKKAARNEVLDRSAIRQNQLIYISDMVD